MLRHQSGPSHRLRTSSILIHVEVNISQVERYCRQFSRRTTGFAVPRRKVCCAGSSAVYYAAIIQPNCEERSVVVNKLSLKAGRSFETHLFRQTLRTQQSSTPHRRRLICHPGESEIGHVFLIQNCGRQEQGNCLAQCCVCFGFTRLAPSMRNRVRNQSLAGAEHEMYLKPAQLGQRLVIGACPISRCHCSGMQ